MDYWVDFRCILEPKSNDFGSQNALKKQSKNQWNFGCIFEALGKLLSPRGGVGEALEGSENEVEKSAEKVVPKGLQMVTKSRPKLIESVFWRGLPQKWTLPRIRKSEILLLFTTLWQGRRSQKRQLFGYHFGNMWETESLKLGSRWGAKKQWKYTSKFSDVWVHFGDDSRVKSRLFAGRRGVWHVDP